MNLPNAELAQAVIDHVNRAEYRPVKPKTIAKQLKIPEDGLRELKKTIKVLAKQGQISYGANHLVQKASDKKSVSLVEGRFKRTSRGFGFVIPLLRDPKLPSDDVFVSETDAKDAADGDIVSVKLSRKRGPYGKRTGHVVEIVDRRTTTFVGTYHVQRDLGLVTVDGGQFPDPVVVGDASAKGCQPGDKVVLEMLRFPSAQLDGQGVVIEVLGAWNKPGVDTLTIMREFGLPEDFPEGVLSEARLEADRFADEIPADRDDLTATTIITIDPIDARDFDDAISLEQIENGHWRLGVHIADVAHFVRPNSSIDNEAYARATSVYLPDRVVPMIPELISNGLASLQPDRVRFARTAWIEFTADGQRVGTEVRRSAIKSKRRFTYEEVDDYLEDAKAWSSKLEPDVHALLGRMHTLAMLLRQRRLEGGAIELGLPEVKIDMDKHGKVIGAHTVEHTESHQIIEEFMLAANMAVAETIADRGHFLLRRIHPNPSPRKLKDLTSFARGLGVECQSLESRFEIKRVLGEVEGEPIEHAVNLAVLKSMQKAVYSPREEGHYALNAEAYCHFTSPIRRYPDLVVHRMMDALQGGHVPAAEFGHLNRLGFHCSVQEQNAEKAERELVKLKLINFLAERIGMELHARINGVEPYGVFVQGQEIPAEGLVPLEQLGDDRYDYDGATQSLTGRRSGEILRLGDEITVQVITADADQRLVEMARVVQQGGPGERLDRRATGKTSKKGGSKSGRASKRNVPKKSAGHGSSGKRGRTPKKQASHPGAKSARGSRKRSGRK